MGQDKTKTLQAGLQDFRFFLQIPDLWGIIRAHQRNPWLVFLLPRVPVGC
jgi:hypothetical protein